MDRLKIGDDARISEHKDSWLEIIQYKEQRGKKIGAKKGKRIEKGLSDL